MFKHRTFTEICGVAHLCVLFIANVNAEPASSEIDRPQRTTQASIDQIAQMLFDLKQCADVSIKKMHMNQCYCLSDLKLSSLPPPENPQEYCTEIARQNTELQESGSDSMFISGASDISISSGPLFAFAIPCLMEAIEKKDRNAVIGCACITQEIANAIFSQTFSNSKQMADALDVAARNAVNSKNCGL